MMVYDADVGWTGNILGGATMWITDGLGEPEIEDARDGLLALLLQHRELGFLAPG